jgi:hypothetical protein
MMTNILELLKLRFVLVVLAKETFSVSFTC